MLTAVQIIGAICLYFAAQRTAFRIAYLILEQAVPGVVVWQVALWAFVSIVSFGVLLLERWAKWAMVALMSIYGATVIPELYASSSFISADWNGLLFAVNIVLYSGWYVAVLLSARRGDDEPAGHTIGRTLIGSALVAGALISVVIEVNSSEAAIEAKPPVSNEQSAFLVGKSKIAMSTVIPKMEGPGRIGIEKGHPVVLWLLPDGDELILRGLPGVRSDIRIDRTKRLMKIGRNEFTATFRTGNLRLLNGRSYQGILFERMTGPVKGILGILVLEDGTWFVTSSIRMYGVETTRDYIEAP